MGAVLAERTLVRICDLAGRPRGTGFVADGTGTVITSHEAVDGLSRVVVHAPGGPSHTAEADGITSLPEWDLALIATEGLGLAPLLIGAERPAVRRTRVRLFTGDGAGAPGSDGTGMNGNGGGWTEGELAGSPVSVTYTSTGRRHELEGALELTLPEEVAARLRLNVRASGSPVLDATTGAVLAVLGTALHSSGACPRTGFAVPLRTAGLWDQDGELSALLARNGASVPGFGPDLNLAGALRLTAATVRPAAARRGGGTADVRRVDRREVVRALEEFGRGGASVTALVGRPGTGRTTELAALAERRAAEASPAPTVWLRGAELREGDGSVREALGRALEAAVRGLEPPGAAHVPAGADASGAARPDVVARLAREARSGLLVLLDAPEEMPPRLARDLRGWAAGTAGWLRASGARMVVACGPEQWAELGELFPAGLLSGGCEEGGDGAGALPCVRLGDLSAARAARARELYGLGADDIAPGDAGHPLALRMLADIRAAQGGAGGERGEEGGGAGGAPVPCGHRTDSGPEPPGRDDVFAAHLDLVALRIADRLAGTSAGTFADTAGGRASSARTVRRLAARTSGALHEAARRCLGPAHGALRRGDFDELFPRHGGWGEAVLAEGVLEAAGDEYRFADEEFGDWLQGRHLDVGTALEALVNRGGSDGRGGAAPARMARHRIGPVVHALVLSARLEGAQTLERRLRPLAEVVIDGSEAEAVWWARRLLRETLLRVPDARPYYGLLRGMAEHFATEGRRSVGVFGPPFWRGLALPTAQRTGLLRLLLPVDAPPSGGGDGKRGEERFLDVVGGMLEAEPATVQPLLCGWFTDRRPLTGTTAPAGWDGGGHGADGVPRPTVASAAQALLYAHRRQAPDMTLDLLTDACHPRADELLGDLAQEEPSALCRAVERWAHDERTLRQIAAAEYGPLLVGRARTEADRRRLERGAQALLRIPGGSSRHGPAALAMLLRLAHGRPDPADAEARSEREGRVAAALGLLAATGSDELSRALTDEVADRPAPVLAAFRSHLCEQPGSGAHHLAAALAAVSLPDLAVPTAEVVREYAEMRPETAADALAGFVRRRLAARPEGCEGLRLLTDALVCAPYGPLRASVVRVLGALGGPVPQELLGVLLVGERDPAVLEAALEAAAHGRPDTAGKAPAQARVPCVSH